MPRQRASRAVVAGLIALTAASLAACEKHPLTAPARAVLATSGGEAVAGGTAVEARSDALLALSGPVRVEHFRLAVGRVALTGGGSAVSDEAVLREAAPVVVDVLEPDVTVLGERTVRADGYDGLRIDLAPTAGIIPDAPDRRASAHLAGRYTPAGEPPRRFGITVTTSQTLDVDPTEPLRLVPGRPAAITVTVALDDVFTRWNLDYLLRVYGEPGTDRSSVARIGESLAPRFVSILEHALGVGVRVATP